MAARWYEIFSSRAEVTGENEWIFFNARRKISYLRLQAAMQSSVPFHFNIYFFCCWRNYNHSNSIYPMAKCSFPPVKKHVIFTYENIIFVYVFNYSILSVRPVIGFWWKKTYGVCRRILNYIYIYKVFSVSLRLLKV